MSETGGDIEREQLSVLIGGLQLLHIRLHGLVVRSDAAALADAAGSGPAQMDSMTGIVAVDGSRVVFNAAVRTWAPAERSPADADLLIQTERHLLYEGIPAGTSQEVLAEFARTSVMLAAWPYLRADVHHACLELDIPPLLLPLVKAPRSMDGAASHATGAGFAWQAWREELSSLLERAEEFVLHGHASSLDSMGPGEALPANWGLLVDLLRQNHASLLRRLGIAGRESDIEGLVEDCREWLRRLQQLVGQRAEGYRAHHAETLIRWNELAGASESLFGSMSKAGIPGAGDGLRLRRH